MTSIGKNVYYDVLDDIVNEYNKSKHSTNKMKPKDVKNDTTKLSAIARNKRVYNDEHNEKSARYNEGDRVVNNDVVKKTDYNTKVTSIESQVAGVTKNTLGNLGDITKLKAVDTSNFVLKTKLASDVTTLENKVDTVDTKIPDISG